MTEVAESPTCPICSEPVSGIHATQGGSQLQPCGHTVTDDVTRHWQRTGESVEYVPEDVAAREEVDGAGERATVSCDEACGAFLEPMTLDEYQAALEHWMTHASLGGCSHGRQ